MYRRCAWHLTPGGATAFIPLMLLEVGIFALHTLHKKSAIPRMFLITTDFLHLARDDTSSVS